MANINVYPRFGNDFTNFFSDVCPTCGRVHHIYGLSGYNCRANGYSDLANYTPVCLGSDIPSGVYRGVTFNATNLYAAIGTNQAASSANGTAWTNQAMPPVGSSPRGLLDFASVAWNGSLYCAVGTDISVTSTDGTVGTFRNMPPGKWTAVAWDGSTQFVAVSFDGQCATSPDGTTWTLQTIPAGRYTALAYNGSTLWMAIGQGVCATSADGITWTAKAAVPALNFTGIAFGNSVFACIANGVCYTTPAGAAFTKRTTMPAGDWQAILLERGHHEQPVYRRGPRIGLRDIPRWHHVDVPRKLACQRAGRLLRHLLQHGREQPLGGGGRPRGGHGYSGCDLDIKNDSDRRSFHHAGGRRRNLKGKR